MSKKNYGHDGFTMEEAIDIMLSIERSTVEQACRILIDLGYSDTFYYDSRSYTIEKFLEAVAASGHYLAETFDNVTFQGGPQGDSWYTLPLQCLLEDHVCQSLCVYGAEAVSRSLTGVPF